MNERQYGDRETDDPSETPKALSWKDSVLLHPGSPVRSLARQRRNSLACLFNRRFSNGEPISPELDGFHGRPDRRHALFTDERTCDGSRSGRPRARAPPSWILARVKSGSMTGGLKPL